MTDEPYPEVPREVLRPARPPEKRGAISARLRERPRVAGTGLVTFGAIGFATKPQTRSTRL